MFLIGQYDSPFVRRTAIALRLYDLPFEHRPWSTFGDADKIAPYNPLRRVPTLVLDSGEALIESFAILDYLDDLVGPEYRDVHSLMFTSGTTGPSKGVLFSQHFLANFAHLAVRAFGFERSDMIYSVLPFFHANALVLMTCGSLLVGAPATIARRFSVSRFWKDAIACQGTVTSMLGSMATLLFQQAPAPQEREHRITRSMLVPAPTEYYAIMTERFGIVPLDMYGQSDAGILISPTWRDTIKPG